MGASWAQLGASWAQLGASWAPLGLHLEPIRPKLGALGRNLVQVGRFLVPLQPSKASSRAPMLGALGGDLGDLGSDFPIVTEFLHQISSQNFRANFCAEIVTKDLTRIDVILFCKRPCTARLLSLQSLFTSVDGYRQDFSLSLYIYIYIYT